MGKMKCKIWAEKTLKVDRLIDWLPLDVLESLIESGIVALLLLLFSLGVQKRVLGPSKNSLCSFGSNLVSSPGYKISEQRRQLVLARGGFVPLRPEEWLRTPPTCWRRTIEKRRSRGEWRACWHLSTKSRLFFPLIKKHMFHYYVVFFIFL